jgi:DNA transposition AAA+ family ATPase
MKNIFAVTTNQEQATALVAALKNRNRGIPGLALIYGEPGLGKTRWAIRLADQTNAVFVRALATSTLRSFLEDLVFELGIDPQFRTSDLYRQARKALAENPRLVIVDEIDRLAGSNMAIEVLRDLADEGDTPILMIGMDSAERKLARYRHLFYRMKSHIMRFLPLTEADVRSFSDQICEVKLDDSAIAEIYKITGGRLGDVISELYKAERIAFANDFSTIEGKHLLRRAA